MTTKEIILSVPHGTSEEWITFTEVEDFMKKYTKLKCKELLKLVSEKSLIEETYVSPIDGGITKRLSYAFGTENTEYSIDENSILNAVNLDEFIK